MLGFTRFFYPLKTGLCFLFIKLASLSQRSVGHSTIKKSLVYGDSGWCVLKAPTGFLGSAPSRPRSRHFHGPQFASFFDASSKFSTRSVKQSNNVILGYDAVFGRSSYTVTDPFKCWETSNRRSVAFIWGPTWNVIVLLLDVFCLWSLAVQSCDLKKGKLHAHTSGLMGFRRTELTTLKKLMLSNKLSAPLMLDS